MYVSSLSIVLDTACVERRSNRYVNVNKLSEDRISVKLIVTTICYLFDFYLYIYIYIFVFKSFR